MGFQSGTKVNPRLGALDYSGFNQAAAINMRTAEKLGGKIEGAVNKYMTDKREKEQKEMRYAAILPHIESQTKDPEMAKTMAKQFSNDPELGGAILKYANIQQNQKAISTAIAASTTPSGDILWDQVPQTAIELGASDPSEVMGMAQKAKEAEYQKNTLMDLDGTNREAMKTAASAATDTDGKVNADQFLHAYSIAGGTDMNAASKVAKAFKGNEITVKELGDYLVMTQEGKGYVGSVPKPKNKEAKETEITAMQKNLNYRQEKVSEAQKLFEEGKTSEANSILLAIGIDPEAALASWGGGGIYGQQGNETPEQVPEKDPAGFW